MKTMTTQGQQRHDEYVRGKMQNAVSVVSLGSMSKLILLETVTAAALEAGARNPDLCPVCGAAEDEQETCPHCVWGVPAVEAVKAMDHIAKVNA
jgi:hypothetical protein